MEFLDRTFEGFSQTNNETMEMLTKALSAGTGVDAGSFTGGRALTPESLDYTLVNILHNQDEARLFQRLKKKPIKSVIHQWNQRTEVGADDGAWVAEGGTSQSTDQTVARKYLAAKYLQTLRTVTLQAAMSDMVENAMALEKEAGTLWLIRNVEKGIIDGNSAYVSEQPDGLVTQIPSTNVIDMRGGHAFSSEFEAKITEGCRIIRDNYGKASLFLGSTKTIQDVQGLLKDKMRWPIGMAAGQQTDMGVPIGQKIAGGVIGSAFPTNYPTPFGAPEILDDIFIKEGGIPVTGALATVPDAPTLASLTHPAAATLSKFGSSDAGAYAYKVVAVNKYGDSVASSEILATGVVAGDEVTFTITHGTTVPTAYKIYRSKVGGITGAEVRYMETVAYTGSPQTYHDYNENLPGCSNGFLLTMDPVYDAIEWYQFLPLMKFDLYPTNAAVWPFLMLLFGGIALKKPVQHIRIKNICPSDGGYF
jgi:hypothetical protein